MARHERVVVGKEASMRITKLKRLDKITVECSLEYGDHRCTAIVKTLVDGEIRGFHLSGLSPEEKRHLYNASEGIDFTRQLWRFVDGENVTTPIELQPSIRDTKNVCAKPP
jgi:hypothetical protein